MAVANPASLASLIKHITDDFNVTHQRLGRGTYGDVYKGYRKSGGEPVAVKTIELKESVRQKIKIERELKALGGINHPNIVRLFDVDICDKESIMYIFMEYCEHRDLEKYLRGKELSEEHMMRFIQQSAEAILFLHTMCPPIIHRDIKPGNFLITTQDGQPQLKVADLGLARELGTSGRSISATQAGTPLYMAPEVFPNSSRAHYGKKVDTFSHGIFILSILNYSKDSGIEAITVKRKCVGEWMNLEKRNCVPDDLPTRLYMQDARLVSSLKTMAHKMIQYDPADRIDMSHVCQNIVTINNELGYENATRVQHHTLTDVGFVLVKLSSAVTDLSGPLRIVVGQYPGVLIHGTNQREFLIYNLNGDDDQINLSWKKAIPSGFAKTPFRCCLDERGNIWAQKDLNTIHVLDHAFHSINTLPARGRLIFFISEGFRIYGARCPQTERSPMWKLSLEQSDGTIVHTFQDREYKPADIEMVVDPVHARTVIAVDHKKLLQIHDATGALKHEVKLDYQPGKPACTQDNIFIPVEDEARVEVYSWSGARLYSLNHDELGIPSTAHCRILTPVCKNRTLLYVTDRSSGEYSLHAYRLDNAPSSCVLTSGSMDTTE